MRSRKPLPEAMELEYYQQYWHFKAIGRRDEARQSIQRFVDSFRSIAEKEQWTRQFLENEYDDAHKIRHELYEGVVFPVLLKGYQNRDPWSVLWLSRTVYNLNRAAHLSKQIGFKQEYDLLEECYRLDPSHVEVRKELLRVRIQWLEYYIHEHPTGILYRFDNPATIENCQKILSEVEFARELDIEKTHKKLIDDVQLKVLEYLDRL